MNTFETHITRHLPGKGTIVHELITSQIHIDIHIRFPYGNRNYYTLITSGMSNKPMKAPYDLQQYRFAELLMCLPPTWDLSENGLNDEKNYWPLRCLRTLALHPHKYDTWLWTDHTVPNGEPPKPYSSNTKLCCALLSRPSLFERDFVRLKTNDQTIIHFLSLVPLYKEEYELNLRKGRLALFEKLNDAHVDELLNIHRKNTCKILGLF